MDDVYALIEACGPVLGLILFIALKYLESKDLKPHVVAIESKIDLLLKQSGSTDAKPIDESDDSGSAVPTQETVR